MSKTISSRAALLLGVTVLLAAMSACSTGMGGREVSFRGDSAPGLRITIRNQRTQHARFWIWIDGRRETLGSVQSTGTETFQVRLDRVSNVRLEFDLTLGARCFTRTVSLEPGSQLDVTIPVNLRLMDVRCG